MPVRADGRGWIALARVLLPSLATPIAGASAEPCRLVGCANQVFYIFMPDANLVPETDAAFTMAGPHCKSPDSSQTFLRKGLPAVNEVATLKAVGRWVYTQQQLEEEIDLFQPLGADRSSTEDCAIIWKAPDGGGSLDPGMKLRVLGYRTFVSHRKTESSGAPGELYQTATYPEQLLFAMVLVE